MLRAPLRIAAQVRTSAPRRLFFDLSHHESLLSIDGTVATLTLNNGSANVLSLDYLLDLRGALKEAEDNRDVEALVITARKNGIFCAGLELHEVVCSFPQK